MFWLKLFVWIAIAIGGVGYATHYETSPVVEQRRDVYLRQFENDDTVPQTIRRDYWNRDTIRIGAVAGWLVLGLLFFGSDIGRSLQRSGR